MTDWLNALLREVSGGHPASAEEFASHFTSQSWEPKGWFDDFMAASRRDEARAR